MNLKDCEGCKLDGTLECEMCDKRVCRVCGCTWNNACPGGCYWVEFDLCSQCVGMTNAQRIVTDVDAMADLIYRADDISPEICQAEYDGRDELVNCKYSDEDKSC